MKKNNDIDDVMEALKIILIALVSLLLISLMFYVAGWSLIWVFNIDYELTLLQAFVVGLIYLVFNSGNRRNG